MTIAEMRAILGLGDDVCDAAVVDAYAVYVEGKPAPEIVTLEDAKAWLRVTEDWEDDTIQALIDAATESALAVANGYDRESDAPPSLKLAILAHIERAFTNRDTTDAPETNARLLSPLRVLEI